MRSAISQMYSSTLLGVCQQVINFIIHKTTIVHTIMVTNSACFRGKLFNEQFEMSYKSTLARHSCNPRTATW